MNEKSYTVNEIYASLQGEGMRAGTFNVFVRFTGCNLKCVEKEGLLSPGGFDCDTEFASGRPMSADEIVEHCLAELVHHRSHSVQEKTLCGVIFTGGEPALQLNPELVSLFHRRGFGPICIETNGSKNIDHLGLDWITVSPKVAEHAIQQKTADEVKYVRGYGQAIPKTEVRAVSYLISPAFDGIDLGRRNLDWCIQLVKDNSGWRLSVQMHKVWNLR